MQVPWPFQYYPAYMHTTISYQLRARNFFCMKPYLWGSNAFAGQEALKGRRQKNDF